MKNLLSISLGKILSKKRKLAQRSTLSISNYLGLGHSLYRMMESGNAMGSSHAVIKICDLYGFDFLSLSFYHSLALQLDSMVFTRKSKNKKELTQINAISLFIDKKIYGCEFLEKYLDSKPDDEEIIELIENFLHGGLNPYLKKETRIKSFTLENPDFFNKLNDLAKIVS
jgi:transcriptional regulator with XRE-family HTH domain